MAEPIRAIFEHGVFRPEKSPSLREGSPVLLHIEEVKDRESGGILALFGNLPEEDARRMKDAIEEACEQVDPDEWR